MPLLVHGESPQRRRRRFRPRNAFHRSAAAAADRTLSRPCGWCSSTSRRREPSHSSPRREPGVAATITPQHLLHNRNAIFTGRHPTALLLPADLEARARPAGAAGRGDRRQPALFPGHRQRAARARREAERLRLCRHVHGSCRASNCMPRRSSRPAASTAWRRSPAISAPTSMDCRATRTRSP